MAEAGFYWCGTMQENDAAACFLCGKVLDGWESTDNPWSEHKKHSPQCAFVKFGRPEDDLTVSNRCLDIYFVAYSPSKQYFHVYAYILCDFFPNKFYIIHLVYRLASNSICWICTCKRCSIKNWKKL